MVTQCPGSSLCSWSYLGSVTTRLQSSRGLQRPAHSSASATSSCQGPGLLACSRCCSSVPRSTWKSFRGERCPAWWARMSGHADQHIRTSFIQEIKATRLWDGLRGYIQGSDPCTGWETQSQTR